MKSCILLSVVFIQLGWTYGDPAPAGVGAYAYQDSAGNSFRRTFTSTWEDDDPFEPLQRLMPFRPFEPLKPLPPLPPLIPFQPLPPLPPLEPLFPPLQRSARFLPPLPPLPPLKPLFPRLKPLRPFKSRLNNFNFGGFPPFEMPMPMGPNSAFAGAAAGPGFTHQVAALNPENPSEPNVNVMSRFGEDVPRAGRGKYVSVSSSSFSSSSNVNGKEKTHKAAETYVNNNGKVTHYRVES